MSTGYRHCACGPCFETAIGEQGALCWECEEAGCEPGDGGACMVADASAEAELHAADHHNDVEREEIDR